MPASSPADESIWVTGAAGFVGAHLCLEFAQRGHPVTALVRSGDERPWRLQDEPRVRMLALDLTDHAAVAEALRARPPAAILHCAAYGAYPSQKDGARIFAVNVEALRALLEACTALPVPPTVIAAGSSSEYGDHCTRPAEDGPFLPDSLYSASKIAAHALVSFYGRKRGLRAFTLRLYSVYGALEESSRLIPKLIEAGEAGGYPPLANPRISRDFIHVDDVCAAFAAVLARARTLTRGEAFNVGTGKMTTLGDAAEAARQAFGIERAPEFGTMPDRAWDHPDWVADPGKAERLLGWKAGIDFRQGLLRTAEALRARPEWRARSKEHALA